MKQTLFLFLALFFTQSATANIFSFLNPFAWFILNKQIERPAEILEEIANKVKLKNYLTARYELDNLGKIYRTYKPNWNKDYAMESRSALEGCFTMLQLKLSATEQKDFVYLCRMPYFKKTIFRPALSTLAQEHNISERLPKSWYEELKEDETELSDEEKQKTRHNVKLNLKNGKAILS